MSAWDRVISVFMVSPFLAGVPGCVFLVLYLIRRRRPALLTGLAWLLYAGYEYAVKRRLLCSGDCNIRADLLFIYPVLLVVSLRGIVALLRSPLELP